MHRAYEGDETRQLALDLGFLPVVPPNPNRRRPWKYDRAMDARRNEVERLPAPLLTLRQTRRDVHRLHPLRPRGRSAAVVLTG